MDRAGLRVPARLRDGKNGLLDPAQRIEEAGPSSCLRKARCVDRVYRRTLIASLSPT